MASLLGFCNFSCSLLAINFFCSCSSRATFLSKSGSIENFLRGETLSFTEAGSMFRDLSSSL